MTTRILVFSLLWAFAPATAFAQAQSAHPANAAAAPFVQVHIPQDMRAGFVTTTPAGDGTNYVTIQNVAATNIGYGFGWYEPQDFHLLAGGVTYYPVTRPNLAAIDLSWGGSVPPHGTLVATVTFKVPGAVNIADFEFIPKGWYNQWGGTLVFCCLYQF
jgi:hypothetical protein